MNAPAIPPIVAEDRQPQAPAQAPVAERHIGRPLPRTGARRLLQGRGTYLDDVLLPRVAHVVFVRSPHAHARIVGLSLQAARERPGVIAVVDGRTLAGWYSAT